MSNLAANRKTTSGKTRGFIGWQHLAFETCVKGQPIRFWD